ATQDAAITAVTPVTASGGTTPYAFALYNSDNTAAATLPEGLSFSASTGEITGTPTGTLSATTFTVRVSDAANGLETSTFSLTVNEALVATQAVAAIAATEDAAITAVTPVTAAGGTAPYAFALYNSDNTAAATLPAGLSLNASTGEITGTPTVTLTATTFTVRVSDAANGLETATFIITVVDKSTLEV